LRKRYSYPRALASPRAELGVCGRESEFWSLGLTFCGDSLAGKLGQPDQELDWERAGESETTRLEATDFSVRPSSPHFRVRMCSQEPKSSGVYAWRWPPGKALSVRA